MQPTELHILSIVSVASFTAGRSCFTSKSVLFISGSMMLISSMVAYMDDVMGCMSATMTMVNMQLKHCNANIDMSNVMFHGISWGRTCKKDSITA